MEENTVQVEHTTEASEWKTYIENANTYIKEILDKTQNLEKIESQQKILALNASIEAARAGDAGKGFAIVATKVGTLAASSAEVNSSIKQSLQKLDKTISALRKLEK